MRLDYGDPRLPERFWEKVYPCPITGCWIWGAAADKLGYGRYNHKRVVTRAYAVAYVELVGPVGDGLELDHLCRVTCCVNPEHLEPVTHAENIRRMLAVRYATPKPACDYGHEFTEENTRRRKDGGRDCKACDLRRGRAYSKTERARELARERQRRYMERKRECA